MPLIRKENSTLFGHNYLWKIVEDEAFFKNKLDLTGVNINPDARWKLHRRLEWFAGRYLISVYLDIAVRDIIVDTYGKPHIHSGKPHIQGGQPHTSSGKPHISISHSNGFVALAYHHSPIGIDIQQKNDRISRMAHKFCLHEEYELLPDHLNLSDKQHVIWGTKEAVYKAYGRRALDFRKHISLISVKSGKRAITIKARLSKSGLDRYYMLRLTMVEGLYLVIGIDCTDD